MNINVSKRRSFRLSLFVSLTLCLSSCNVGFVYSLCIVWSTNYTHRKTRNISKMQSLCRVLCIVCIVFLFSLFLTYIVMQANRGKTLHFIFPIHLFPFLFLHYFHFLFSSRLWNCRSTAIASFLFAAFWNIGLPSARRVGLSVRAWGGDDNAADCLYRRA